MKVLFLVLFTVTLLSSNTPAKTESVSMYQRNLMDQLDPAWPKLA